MTIPSFQGVPEYLPDEKQHRRKLAQAVNSLTAGKMNIALAITLNKSATSTVVNDSRISAFSWLGLMPLTADAATAYIAGIYFSNQINGQVTINHASSSAADQNFTLSIIG